MKKLVEIIIFLLFVFKLNAQTVFVVNGYLRDSTDGTALPNAFININYGKTGTFTDNNGFYELKVNYPEFIISVRYLSYNPFRQQVNLSKPISTLNINLLKTANDLEEVVVSSKVNTNDIRRPTLGVNTLSIKALAKIPTAMGEVDILRGLQLLPGVTSVGEAANGVNIRGGATDQNLFLIDDMPIFNPTHLFGLFSAFPTDGISSFDLYKGNVPARFGGRAASVLDVSLSQPSLNKFSVQGGIGIVSNRFRTDIPIIKDKMGLMLSSRGAFNDFMFPLISKRLADIKARFGDGALKWFFKINTKHTLTISSYWSKDFFQTKLLGTISGVDAKSTQYDYQTLSGSIRWFWGINSKLNLQTTIVCSQYIPITIIPESKSESKIKFTSVIDYQQFKSNLNRYNEKNKFEIGISVTKYRINPGMLNPDGSTNVRSIHLQNENSYETGLYLEDEWSISDRISMSLGLRYSHFFNVGPIEVQKYIEGKPKDNFSVVETKKIKKGDIAAQYGGVEPRIGLQYSLSKFTSIKVGYNLMRQYIQVISNTTTPLPTSRWKTADLHIKPQISYLYTTGIFQNLKNNIFEISLEGYYRKTENILDYKPGAEFIFNQFPETELLSGVNRSYGLELMISKKKGELRGWINYTYSRSLNQVSEGSSYVEQVNYGKWYPSNFDRPHSFNTTVIINQGKHHDFSFNFTYSTGRPYTLPTGIATYQSLIYPFFDIRNNFRIDDYHRLDFAWNIYQPSLKNRRWKSHWTFTIYNLYGRRNAYSIYTKVNNGLATANSISLSPLNFTLETNKLLIFATPITSLGYNFKFM